MLKMVNKERLGKYLVIATGVIIVLVVLLVIVICDGNHRMRTLDGSLMYGIYVDDLTGVQYLRTSYGGICVMVDAEGKPLIWGEAE